MKRNKLTYFQISVSVLVIAFILIGSYLSAQSKLSLSLQREIDKKEYNYSFDLFVSANNDLMEAYCNRNSILIKYQSSDYFAIHISKEQLIKLSKQKFISKIHWSNSKGELLNDQMLLNANVLGLKQIGIYDSLLDGRGVIMGFIDSGLDYTHPDFIKENGESRILYFWDQKTPQDSSDVFEEYGYGHLILKDSLDHWLENDIEIVLDPNSEYGHGTTVVGAACSNGRALEEELESGTVSTNFEGIVPASDIIMVASDFNKENWLSSVADGVHFMLEAAEELDRPIVINLSVGSYSGSHDANDPVGELINSWFADDYSGRFLVCAGGNSRTLRYHLGYSNMDTSFSIFSSFNGPPEYGRMATFEAFVDSIDEFSHQIALYDNTNGQILPYQSTNMDYLTNMDSTYIDSIFDDESNLLAIIKRYNTYHGEQIQFQVQVDHLQDPSLDIVLYTYGQHYFNTWSAAWLGSSNIRISESLPSSISDDFQFHTSDSLMQIVSSFSCAENVMTVSNYVNRVSYTDINGDVFSSNDELGSLALHSSRGPTRDGRIKPNLSASGELILSSGPFNYREILLNSQAFKLAEGGWHMRNGGSSMASPIVAGIAAMYLQRCPNSPPSLVHSAILNSAYQDIHTGQLPNTSWGYGKVDGLASLNNSIDNIPILESSIDCGGGELELSIEGLYEDVLWSNGETSNEICVSEGDFWVMGIDVNGCLQRSDIINVIPNDITSYESTNTLFPNPSTGVFIINALEENSDISIFNSAGKTISFKTKRVENGIKFELADASPGLYIIRENRNGKTWELIIKH